MFRTPVAEPDAPAPVQADDTIPLSHLELDLPAPVSGWHLELDRRGIEVVLDHVGRSAISCDAARQLLAEQRQNEIRAREVAERNEQRAIEADKQRRAQLPAGIPWFEIPVGATAAEVWAQAEKDAQPKRESVLQHALSNSGELEYHPLPTADES